MTWSLFDTSRQSGAPVTLYTFETASATYRYTPRRGGYTLSGSPELSFTELPLRHSNIRSTSRREKEEILITLPASNAFAASLVRRYAPDVALTIQRVHETDGDQEVIILRRGWLAQATRALGIVVARFRSDSAAAERQAGTVRMLRHCNWALYSDECGVDPAGFEVSGTVTAIDGLEVTVTEAASAPATDYYVAGQLAYAGERRAITDFDKTTGVVTLMDSIDALTEAFADAGTAGVTLRPGCNLTRAVCASRFDNIPNNLSAEELPLRERVGGGDRMDR